MIKNIRYGHFKSPTAGFMAMYTVEPRCKEVPRDFQTDVSAITRFCYFAVTGKKN